MLHYILCNVNYFQSLITSYLKQKMFSKLREVWHAIIEIIYLEFIKEETYTAEDSERVRVLFIDVCMFFLELFGNIIVWLIIGFYIIHFINMLLYCNYHDDFSVDAAVRYIKYEVVKIDPEEEERRIAHEILKEKHRQAAELYKQLWEKPTKK